MAWVYILKCRDGSYYVGSTPDLQKRVWEHEQGIACAYTSCRRPVVLVWSQEMASLEEAFRAERQIKGWSRRKKEALIEGRYEDLPKLSHSKARESEDRRRVC